MTDEYFSSTGGVMKGEIFKTESHIGIKCDLYGSRSDFHWSRSRSRWNPQRTTDQVSSKAIPTVMVAMYPGKMSLWRASSTLKAASNALIDYVQASIS